LQFTTIIQKKGELPMKKQIKVSMTIAAALVAMSGIAQAAPAELNIYGASAQYLYWNDQAQNFAQIVLGCTATAPVNNGGKHGFVSAINCTNEMVPVNGATGKRDLDIRYSGIASAEGPLSVAKAAPLDATLATGCDVANGYRKMYASETTTVCKQVHVGTSDVAGESLNQVSSGQKFGPLGGGAFSAALSGVNTTGLTSANTVVVPFGFFVNNAVTATKCTAGFVGNYCTTASDCGTGGACSSTATTIDNITREQAVLLFSQQTADWSDFGAYFTAQPTVVCLRHAGSGTAAALDKTVMSNSWGSAVVTAEADGAVWFNQGSGDQVKCINGNSTATPTGSLIGAIGYADADQAVGTANTSQNIQLIKYNGVYPTRAAIRNGLYDFYTNAWLYTNPANGTTVNGLAASLVTFAQNPDHVPATKANFWAAVGEMKYNRTSDVTYPVYIGASIPKLP
jgi:ABC-type phosphate transport system substrate-binding protein